MEEMDLTSPRTERVMGKIKAKGVVMNPPIPWERLEAFERKHGVILPPEYREFILEFNSHTG